MMVISRPGREGGQGLMIRVVFDVDITYLGRVFACGKDVHMNFRTNIARRLAPNIDTK